MVVIMGWGGGDTKDLGEVAPASCPNCHNQVFLHQLHSTKQFSRVRSCIHTHDLERDLIMSMRHTSGVIRRQWLN